MVCIDLPAAVVVVAALSRLPERERERVRTVRPSVLSLLTPRSSLTRTHIHTDYMYVARFA